MDLSRFPFIPMLLMAAIALSLTLFIRASLERRAEIQEMQALRDSLVVLRYEAESCRNLLARDEAEFRRFSDRVDSLRTEVRAYEALDDRGVPGEQYDDYLSAFELYNESVEVWQRRADDLEASAAACTEQTQRHNALAEEVRARTEARAEDAD